MPSPNSPSFPPKPSFSSPPHLLPTPPRTPPPPLPRKARTLRAQLQHQQREAEVDLSALPPKLQEIIALFQSVPVPKAKYQQLLHYGAQLPPLDPRFKADDRRVGGCVSYVWVRALSDVGEPATIRFAADCDSALTKGLAALLVFGLSGSPAPVIAAISPGFVHLLGLQQSLTSSRNNGFLNMLNLMQQKALQLYSQVGDSEVNGVSESKGSNSDAKGGILENKNSVLGEKLKKLSKIRSLERFQVQTGATIRYPLGV